MPPQIATLICIFFILYLFWAGRKKIDGVSKAIWIPQLWIYIAGSRFISHWFNFGAPRGADVYLEGSPIDRAIFLILILAGAIILVRRRPNWSELLTQNTWIWFFFLFGAISIFWSDYPFVAFKRLIKALGNVVMVLIILTEQRPYDALGLILRRLVFLLMPLSVLFIKYYPDIGRAYHMGMPMFIGVTTQKNSLGAICLISGIYFCWNLLLGHQEWIALRPRLHFPINFIILSMIGWLTYKANSATALACLIVAVSLLVAARQTAVARKPRRILILCIVSIVLLGLMEFSFGVKDTIITMLGRRPDLTTRIPMWEDLLGMVKNPILGIGYESFWLGDRLKYMAENWGITNQAHNGYLEMYLNLGLIGLFFLLSWILSGLKKVMGHLAIDYPTAIFRLCIIVVVVIYNWTEATFYGVNNLWVLFLFVVMERSGQGSTNLTSAKNCTARRR